MPNSDADRNLLYGLLALQNHFIDQADLIAAFHDWTRDKDSPIGEILIGRGLLDAEEQALLDALSRKHLEDCRDDAGPVPARVGPAEAGHPAGDLYTGPTRTAPGDGSTGAPGRFRILRPLARGGLGEVFVASDMELGREVALKQLQGHLADDPDSRLRFIREAEVTGGLEHPGVVPVYGLGRDADGRFYYAMRLIQGDSLKRAIARFHEGVNAVDDPGGRALGLRRLLRHLLDVCDAVEYAHSRGVLHRDLKPSNIMLGKYGETLVVDWGLAKTVGRPESAASDERTLRPASASGSAVETLPGSALGTPQFMSPEQAAGQLDRVTPATDVYSLGAILYCLLTGKVPFEGEDVGQVLKRVQRGDFPPPRRADPSVAPALEAICLKAMALDPGGRYASPARLADDIEHWLADEPTTAHRESWAHRLSRWSRRHRAWAQAGAATLALVILVSVGSALIIRSAWRDEAAARLREQGERDRADGQRDRALASLRESRVLSARLALDRGLTLADQRRVPEAMGWMARALRAAPPDAADLDRAIRLNLGLWRASISPIVGWMDHPDAVLAIAFSPDGKSILTGSQDGKARLWDAATGRPMGRPMDHQGAVLAVAFAPGGRSILAGGSDGKARLWDVASGELRVPPMGHRADVRAVAFSPDGKTMATGSQDGEARLWDAATGSQIGPPLRNQGTVLAVAFSPDGKTLLAGDGGATRAWDAGSGVPVGQPVPHPHAALSLAFRPDGKAILAGGSDGLARLSDAATGGPIGPPLDHQGYNVEAVAFSPDGKSILTGSQDNRARVWDAATGGPIGFPLHHSGHVLAVAFDPDGRSYATGGRDRSARLWMAPAIGPIGPAMDHPAPITSAAYRPDGRAIVTGCQDGSARIWDAANATPVGKPLLHRDVVLSVAFGPDGKSILTGSQDRTARLWDAATGAPAAPPMEHGGIVWVVAFRPDGKSILTGCSNGKVQLWDAATCRPMGRPMVHAGAVRALAFSPDGLKILTGGARLARLWDVATGEPIGPQIEHQGWVTCVAFSPDGRLILTGSRDGTVQLREAASLRPIEPPMAHRAAVLAAAFSPDGRTIVTGDNERMARLWDADTGLSIGRMPPLGDSILAVGFRPDGRAFLAGAGRVASQWPVPSPIEGDVEQVERSVQVMTGRELGPSDSPIDLGGAAWRERRRSRGSSDQPPPP